MNLNEKLPDPDKYRDRDGKIHWRAYITVVAICAASFLLVTKWHEELFLSLIEFFQHGHPADKIVRVADESGQALRDVVISIGGRVCEAKGPQEFHIERKDRGRTAVVYQTKPEEVLTQFVVSFED